MVKVFEIYQVGADYKILSFMNYDTDNIHDTSEIELEELKWRCFEDISKSTLFLLSTYSYKIQKPTLPINKTVQVFES